MKINEKEYKLSMTGYTLVIYKQEFKKDMFQTLSNLSDNIDTVTMLELIWACAKTANKNIPDFEEFANSIENISSLLAKETFNELSECIKKCGSRTVEPKKA